MTATGEREHALIGSLAWIAGARRICGNCPRSPRPRERPRRMGNKATLATLATQNNTLSVRDKGGCFEDPYTDTLARRQSASASPDARLGGWSDAQPRRPTRADADVFGVKEQKIGSKRQAWPFSRPHNDEASLGPQSAAQGACGSSPDPTCVLMPPALDLIPLWSGAGGIAARLPKNPSSPLRRCT